MQQAIKDVKESYKKYQILHGKDFDKENILPIFKECFCDDKYYKEHFLSDISFDSWCESLLPVFEYCLNSDFSYVVVENNKIIGFALAFNYFNCKENNYEMFERIFKDSISNTIPYIDSIHNKIDAHDTVFLLLIAVGLDYRRKRLASQMLDKIILENSCYDIVSDVDNFLSLEMYKKRKFTIQKIESDYFFVKRKYF